MKLNKIALVLAMSGISGTVLAQDAQDTIKQDTVERISVTGSSIKRTNYEGDLPLTVISKADIDAAGITSAEQLMLQLNIASNSNDNLASNAGIVGGEERGNNGSSSANLRQQGAGSTLVLLNGRRIASHGLKGRSVDLNSIPFAAIERVEILRDGASAVYGTDAIGGVINFILRKDFQGNQVGLFADHTTEGSGNIYRFNFLTGMGDIESDGFNVMASVSFKKAEILRGIDRDFTDTFQPSLGLSADTRGTPFASINDRFSDPNNPRSSHYNLVGSGLINPNTGLENDVMNVLALPGQPGCDSFDLMGDDGAALWNRDRNTDVSCAWDYPRASVLQQPVESFDVVTRGTMKLTDNLEGFIEFVGSEVVSNKVFEPNQITPWAVGNGDWSKGGGWYPSTGASYQYIVDALSDYYGADQLNIGAPIAYRWRCMECGPREIETTTSSYKIQLGLDGVYGDWDYKVGLSRSNNESASELGSGYHYTEYLKYVVGTGLISPFLLPGQSQTAEGLAALEEGSARGVRLFGGKTTLTQFDASISGDTGIVFGMDDGTILVAGGVDIRKEEYGFNGDARSADERLAIYGAPFDNGNALAGADRDISAIFVETILPVSKELEVNAAVRYDHYSGFGGTTNPKLGFTYRPIDGLLIRGATSTGFRVPSFNQLFNGTTEEPYTGQDLADPRDCPNGVIDPAVAACATPIQPTRLFGGDVNLGPEESTQNSLGVVYQMTDNFSMNIDYWDIVIDGTIQIPGFSDLLANYDTFKGNFLRDASGEIQSIDLRYINAGERNTSGIELGFIADGEYGPGDWALTFNGSYLLEDKKKLLDTSDFGPNLVGTHSRGNIPLRWKHTLNLSYDYGDFSHNLTQIFRNGYDDEAPPGIAAGDAAAIALASNYTGQVGSYLIYNYSMRYTGVENAVLTVGIKNLLDRDPPFTAHQNDYSPGAAFDPRVADPRGRSITLNAVYNF